MEAVRCWRGQYIYGTHLNHAPPKAAADDPPPTNSLLRQTTVARVSSRYAILYIYGRLEMRTMSYSESRAKYAETLNSVVDDREEVVITRAGHEPVVIVSLDDYQSLKETAYLLKSPKNAQRLLASIGRLEAGEGIDADLIV